MPTVVRRFKTVCVPRTAQEPKTAYSGALGFHKFSVRVRTQFEIILGQRFIIFKSAFPASLAAIKEAKFNPNLQICRR